MNYRLLPILVGGLALALVVWHNYQRSAPDRAPVSRAVEPAPQTAPRPGIDYPAPEPEPVAPPANRSWHRPSLLDTLRLPEGSVVLRTNPALGEIRLPDGTVVVNTNPVIEIRLPDGSIFRTNTTNPPPEIDESALLDFQQRMARDLAALERGEVESLPLDTDEITNANLREAARQLEFTPEEDAEFWRFWTNDFAQPLPPLQTP